MSRLEDDAEQDSDEDFSPLPSEDGPPTPIDPINFATQLYIRHAHDDNGSRPSGWWWHNSEFLPKLKPTSIVLNYTLANKGFMDANDIQLDYLIVTGSDVVVISKNFSLDSGKVQRITEAFDTPGNKPQDGYGPVGVMPWLAVRATDFTTPAPSIVEISKCLLEFQIDRQAAIEKLMDWKRYPSLFIYPCCAIFPSGPQR